MTTHHIRATFKINALSLNVELAAKATYMPPIPATRDDQGFPEVYDVECVDTEATREFIQTFIDADLLTVQIPGVREFEINAGPDYLSVHDGRATIDDQDMNEAISEHLLAAGERRVAA